MKSTRNITLFFFSVLLYLMVALIESKNSIFIFGVFWLLIGLLILNITIKNNNKSSSISLFLFFNFFYIIYMYAANNLYVSNPTIDFFSNIDATKFYEYADELGREKTLLNVVERSFSDFFPNAWRGFALLSGISAFIANLIDSNNIIIQKMIVVFFSAMIISYIYIVLNQHISEKKAFLFTIIYGLLSYSLYYSAELLRDVPIGLFYMMSMYVFYDKLSLKKIPFLLLNSFVIYLFRPEHGLFSLIFIFVYLFLYFKDNKAFSKFAFALLIFPILVIIIVSSIGDIWSIVINVTDNYREFSLDEASSTSLGVNLLQLPIGIRHIMAGAFSQFIPFPFYTSFNGGFLHFPLGIASLFWFFVWTNIFLFFSNKRMRSLLDQRTLLLFFVGVLLILMVSENLSTRRVMCVYPSLYIVAMTRFSSISLHKKRRTVLFSIIVYLVLLLIYLLLK